MASRNAAKSAQHWSKLRAAAETLRRAEQSARDDTLKRRAQAQKSPGAITQATPVYAQSLDARVSQMAQGSSAAPRGPWQSPSPPVRANLLNWELPPDVVTKIAQTRPALDAELARLQREQELLRMQEQIPVVQPGLVEVRSVVGESVPLSLADLQEALSRLGYQPQGRGEDIAALLPQVSTTLPIAYRGGTPFGSSQFGEWVSPATTPPDVAPRAPREPIEVLDPDDLLLQFPAVERAERILG